MCKRKLNLKLKGENPNGFIDPNNNFDITNFSKIKFGNSEPAIKLVIQNQLLIQQSKDNKNLVCYIDDIVVWCESETLK